MTTNKQSSGRIIGGLLLTAVGVLFLLDQMGRLDFGDFISRYWPVFLIVIGLWIIVSNGFRNTGGGLFLVMLGGFFLFMKLDILGKSAWHFFWPLLIIVLGVWIVLKGLVPHSRDFPQVRENDLNISTILSGIERRVESQNFRGGRASTVMGSLELDLTPARLAEDKASIELSAVLGNIEVRVPKEWQVVIQDHPILGGIENNHRFQASASTPQTLHIRATAVLGGIEIKN